MSDDLLDYYNDELRFLREDLARFADRHKGAGRVLQLKKPVPDPHVERLIEAVAGLNARTRLKIDDDFPEIAEALLGMVAPQSLAPVPAMTVIGAALPASLGEAVLGQPIAKGARLETATLEGESTPLTFTTTSDLMLWPMTVERATLEHPVFSDLPQLSVPFPEPVRALVRVRLKSYLPRIPLGQMGVPVPQGEPPRPIPSLRFYLAGSAPEIHQLHELLLAGCMGMTLATAGAKEAVAFDGPKNLYAPGFEEAENLLPNPPRGFFGYRLLTEYFAFPEKFLFLDVSWPPERWCELGPEAELIFYLNRGEPKLTPAVTARTFRLGCVPAINLFTQIADPIPLNQTSAEYLVKPDARNPLSHEVYSIEKVWATTSRGTSTDYEPFYSSRHGFNSPNEEGSATDDIRRFWHAVRRDAGQEGDNSRGATEVFLMLTDLGFRPSAPSDAKLNVETICFNRNRVEEAGLGRSNSGGLSFVDHGGLDVAFVAGPSPVHRPRRGPGVRWRLASMLALNGLTLGVQSDAVEGLREYLKVCDCVNDARTVAVVNGLLSVAVSRVTGKVVETFTRNGTKQRRDFIARGLAASIVVDETRFNGDAMAFGGVLERFLAGYCSLNSFVETRLSTPKREIRKWPRRVGTQPLL